MTTVTAEHHAALSKAKVALMSRPDSAFFTTLCFSLKHVWDNTSNPTACTDGLTCYWNTDFFMQLDQEERVFLMLHETLHCAYLHMLRKESGSYDEPYWNHACDYVINLQLVKRGFKMPKNGLLDEQYEDMSAEQVYLLLKQQPVPPPMSGAIGMDLRPSAQSPEKVQDQMQDILVRAAIQSKQANDKPGTIPGDIQIFLNKLLDPKLPWQRILQKYLFERAKHDYSFRRPNRRFFPQHIIPSLWSEALIKIGIAMDVSGSVSDEESLRVVSEMGGIMKMMKPEKISLIQFDTKIKSVDEVRSFEKLSQVKFIGRGGTRIQPVLEWAIEHKPQVLLIFTDGEFTMPTDLQPKSDIVWLIHGNNTAFKAPFGKVIFYKT